MFVYTFENIGNIKNLKHSDKIKPKHRRKMERIKEGLFANFDYSEFKDKKPPKNESLQTYNELKSLQKLPQDIQFVKEKDRISKVFEKVCERYGVEYPTEMVEKLLTDSAGVIIDLKYHFNN